MMELMQCNNNCEMAKHYIQAWYAQMTSRITDMKLEEDEEEKTSYDMPSSKEELDDWWKRFSQQNKYPLYCMVLATEVDNNVALLIDNYREELSMIARDK
jgi:hypothetical protein